MRSGSAPGPWPGLDQHDRRAPPGDVVAERPHLERIVVAPDAARRPTAASASTITLQARLVSWRAGVLGAGLVVGDRQQRDDGRLRRRADRRAPVLVVQVEADPGSTRSRSALSSCPSGVCRCSASRLMSMPCALRRWKRSAPSGLSIGTMCSVSASSSRRTSGVARWRVRYSNRSKSADVAVGSSPCICDQSRTRLRAAADGEVVNRPAFDRPPEHFARDQARRSRGRAAPPAPRRGACVDERRRAGAAGVRPPTSARGRLGSGGGRSCVAAAQAWPSSAHGQQRADTQRGRRAGRDEAWGGGPPARPSVRAGQARACDR